MPFDHHVRDIVTQDTPLMVAAQCGNEPALEFLLQSAIYHSQDVFYDCGKEYVTCTASSYLLCVHFESSLVRAQILVIIVIVIVHKCIHSIW